MTHGLDVDDPIAVKVLVLPALPLGGDVFDWLAAGHDGQELALLVAGTPQWNPEQLARQREQHRRNLRKQRNRRYRDRLRASREAQAERRSPESAGDIRSVSPRGPDIRCVSSSSEDIRDETQRPETCRTFF